MKFKLLKKDIYKYIYLTIALICAFWFISVFELYMTITNGIKDPELGTIVAYKFFSDFWTAFIIALLLFPIYLLFAFLFKKIGKVIFTMLLALIVISQFSLVKYSLTTLLNLGADILGYSYDDMYITVTSSEEMSFVYFLPF